jgi:hypothetical protein
MRARRLGAAGVAAAALLAASGAAWLVTRDAGVEKGGDSPPPGGALARGEGGEPAASGTRGGRAQPPGGAPAGGEKGDGAAAPADPAKAGAEPGGAGSELRLDVGRAPPGALATPPPDGDWTPGPGDPPRMHRRRTGPPPPPPSEADREAAWVDRQRRRNALRVEVLEREVGVPHDAAERAGELLEAALAEKLALYRSLDPEAPDRDVLAQGVAESARRLEQGLTSVLGPAKYAEYKQLDEEGRFVLPDEMLKPPHAAPAGPK